jgi:hypothetical protein
VVTGAGQGLLPLHGGLFIPPYFGYGSFARQACSHEESCNQPNVMNLRLFSNTCKANRWPKASSILDHSPKSTKKVGFINFNLSLNWRLLLTKFGDTVRSEMAWPRKSLDYLYLRWLN